jgi:hypothetical protein
VNDNSRFEGSLTDPIATWSCSSSPLFDLETSSTPRERPIRAIGVSVDDETADGARSHHRDKLTFPVIHGDPAFSKAYRITSLPTIIVIDEQGKIRRTITGSP